MIIRRMPHTVKFKKSIQIRGKAKGTMYLK